MQTSHCPTLESLFTSCLYQSASLLIIVFLTYNLVHYFKTPYFQNTFNPLALTIPNTISLNDNNNNLYCQLTLK